VCDVTRILEGVAVISAEEGKLMRYKWKGYASLKDCLHRLQGEVEGSGESARRSGLSLLCRRFVQMLLDSSGGIHLKQAAKALAPLTKTNSTKATLRRLFDISNVLMSLGLVEKDQAGRFALREAFLPLDNVPDWGSEEGEGDEEGQPSLEDQWDENPEILAIADAVDDDPSVARTLPSSSRDDMGAPESTETRIECKQSKEAVSIKHNANPLLRRLLHEMRMEDSIADQAPSLKQMVSQDVISQKDTLRSLGILKVEHRRRLVQRFRQLSKPGKYAASYGFRASRPRNPEASSFAVASDGE